MWATSTINWFYVKEINWCGSDQISWKLLWEELKLSWRKKKKISLWDAASAPALEVPAYASQTCLSWESHFLGRLIGSLGVPKERGVWNSQGGRKDKLFFLSPHSLGLYNNNVSCLRTVLDSTFCYLKMLIMGVDLVFTRMYLAWGQCYLKM